MPESVRVRMRAANLVEDIMRESGDVFDDPVELTFTGAREKSDSQISSPAPSSDPAELVDNEDTDDEPPAESHTDAPSLSASSAPAGNSARDGIHRQAVARVLHGLESIAPQLQEMLGYLEDVSLAPAEIDRVNSAKNNLDAVSNRLSTLLQDALCPVDTPCAESPPLSSIFPIPQVSAPPHPETPPRSRPQKRPASASLSPTHAPPQKRRTKGLPSENSQTIRTLSFAPRRRVKGVQNRPALSLLPPSPEKPQKRRTSYGIH